MKFSLSTHLFVYDELSEHHLELVKNNNLSAIELWCMNPHFNFHNWQNVKKLSNLLEKHQLTLSSIHTPFYRNFEELHKNQTFSIASDDEAQSKIAVNEITASLKAASDLNAHYAVIHAGNKNDEANEQNITRLTRNVEKLLQTATKLKQNISLENIVGDLSTAKHLLSIINTFSSEHLSACIDTGHAFINKELPDFIKTLGPHIKTTHINDNNGEKDEHLFPFFGKIEWEQTIKAFKEINYNNYWVLEPRKYEESYDKHFEKLQSSIKKLQAIKQ